MRRISSLGAVGALALAVAAPAGAATLGISAPATSSPGTATPVTYSGAGDGGADSLLLRSFYHSGTGACAGTSAAEVAGGAMSDGQQYIPPENPVFRFVSNLTLATGTYRFCAYLEAGLDRSAAPPLALATTVVQVGTDVPVCRVPNLLKLTLGAATKKLTAGGCKIGKVRRPKASAGRTLVVSAQGEPAGRRLNREATVNVTLAVKKKAKKKKR